MKLTAWVNIGSIIVFILSFTTWSFLVTDYLKINNIYNVDVMGVRVESENNDRLVQNNQKGGTNNKNNSILEQALILNDEVEASIRKKIIIPKKSAEVGTTYVRATSAVAVDIESETILHNQNADKKIPIASLTKLMTALVVLDHIKNLDKEIVVIDKEVCNTPTSIIGCPSSTYCISDTLKVGEKVWASDLLKAMLVNSTNDAAVALGKHIAGSQKDFAKLMNKKAKEIGLKNTHFCNPSGLDDDNNPNTCYSSARDVAQIIVYSMKNDKYKQLWDIFQIKEQWFNSVDGTVKHKYASTNILLDSMSNCIGAKTGFTYEAGKTLMMIASHPENKDIKVVSVILNDPYRFNDVQKLFDWVFENYTWK